MITSPGSPARPVALGRPDTKVLQSLTSEYIFPAQTKLRDHPLGTKNSWGDLERLCVSSRVRAFRQIYTITTGRWWPTEGRKNATGFRLAA